MNVPAAGARSGAKVGFDVYGLRVALSGDWAEVVESVRLDFAWFEADAGIAAPDVRLEIERRAPDFDRFGDVGASFVTPRNVVYHPGGRTVVDYFGRAVAVLDQAAGRMHVQGVDEHLVHEVAYLFCLSRIGEHLDACGLTRVHALALSGVHGAVAVMLPSGGGKSTLALQALEEDGVKLLAEDTPLLDRRGRLHPFPLRLGINAVDAERLPSGSARLIERMEFHPKLVLDVDSFRERIEHEPQPLAHVVVGRRSLGREGRLERLPRTAAVGPLLREAVVGLGVYQGMEFVLQRGLRDVAAKSGVAARRAAACAAALRRAQVWRLTVGRDLESNWQALRPLLR